MTATVEINCSLCFTIKCLGALILKGMNEKKYAILYRIIDICNYLSLIYVSRCLCFRRINIKNSF